MASTYLWTLISIGLLTQAWASFDANTQLSQQSDLPSHKADRLEDDLRLEVVDAQVSYDLSEDPPRPVIDAKLSAESARDFARCIRDHVGQVVELLVDGKLFCSQLVLDPQLSGQGCRGSFDVEQAKGMVTRLKAHEAQLTIRVRRAP